MQQPPIPEMTMIGNAIRSAALAALLGGCAGGAPHRAQEPPQGAQADMRAPEAATGFVAKPGWVAQKFMVAAANPY
jgi:hypothetical protein